MNPCNSHQLSLGDNPCFFSNISCLLLVLLVTDHHFLSLQLSSGKSIKPKEIVILYVSHKERIEISHLEIHTYQSKIPICNNIFNSFKCMCSIICFTINSIQNSKCYTCFFLIFFNLRKLKKTNLLVLPKQFLIIQMFYKYQTMVTW